MTFALHIKNWHEDHATIRQSEYPDGSIKLTIYDRYMKPLVVPTVCLADMGIQPKPNHVNIPNYGDTEGILRALQDVGVIGKTEQVFETGVHTRDPLRRRDVHECRLLRTDI